MAVREIQLQLKEIMSVIELKKNWNSGLLVVNNIKYRIWGVWITILKIAKRVQWIILGREF